MKSMTSATLIVAALLATGCTTQSMNNTTKPNMMTNARTVTYKCENGLMPKLTYVNDSTANLTLNSTTTAMTNAVSGSGVRYVSDTGIFGYGGEWHEKNGQAIFSYKHIEGTSAQTTCMAQ